MSNEVFQEIYGHILNDAQRIRKEIMNEWGDVLMFGGEMSKEAIADLSTAARITGLTFDALLGHGVEIDQVPGKKDLYEVQVRGEKYVCHKSAIPSMVGFLEEVSVMGVAPRQAEPTPAPAPMPKPEPIPEPKPEPIHVKEPEPVPVQKVEPKQEPESFYEEPEEEQETHSYSEYMTEAEEDFYSEEPVREEKEEEQPAESFYEEENVSGNDWYADDDDGESYAEESAVQETETPAVNIFDGTAPKIGMLGRANLFMEERRKKEEEFVYSMLQVNLTHSGYSGGGKSHEMTIMIAPLKISRFASPSVPIVVSVFHDGKLTTASSYDQKDEGRNLIQLEVDGFYLLFRGTFDGEGKFNGIVNTTGISANQGDILNVTSEERFGDNAGDRVGNGHIKFNSEIYDEEGTIEVVPFGHPDDNEFVIVAKTEGYVDYIYSSAASGLKKPIIYVGQKQARINCRWENGEMLVDLEE